MSLAAKHRLAHWSYSIHCALQPMPFHSFPIMTACQQRTPYSTPLCQHTRRCILICRQQETGLQCKPGSRGHHAHSLGQPEQHRSICVLDMDLKNGPVQIDTNDLNRTNHDHAGLDIKNGTINDPNFLQFKLNVETTVEPSRPTSCTCARTATSNWCRSGYLQWQIRSFDSPRPDLTHASNA